MMLGEPAQRKALLDRTRTIAVVGASKDRSRASNEIFTYLRALGRFEVVPINPAVDEIDGVPAFPTLTAYAQAHGAPDVVDVFRKASDAVPIAEEAVAIGAKAIWFQLGIVNEQAIELAERAGLDVVADECIKTDLVRFTGGSR